MSGLRVIRLIVGSPQWQLKRVVRDGKDITDVPIDFRDGDVDGVEITLTSAAASVTGTVKDGDKPAAECAVLVFAEDAAKWAHPSRFLAAGRTDAQGHFTVGGLPVADYLVIAVPPVQGQDWMDPATLEQYRGLATRVSVAEGEKAVVALKMIRR